MLRTTGCAECFPSVRDAVAEGWSCLLDVSWILLAPWKVQRRCGSVTFPSELCLQLNLLLCPFPLCHFIPSLMEGWLCLHSASLLAPSGAVMLVLMSNCALAFIIINLWKCFVASIFILVGGKPSRDMRGSASLM